MNSRGQGFPDSTYFAPNRIYLYTQIVASPGTGHVSEDEFLYAMGT